MKRRNSNKIYIRIIIVALLWTAVQSFRLGYSPIQLIRRKESSRIPAKNRPRVIEKIDRFDEIRKKVQQRKENPHPLDPNSDRPYISRPKRWLERTPLVSLEPGQKFRGLIISVRGYGLYIDIGAQTDGMVHISEASDKYFLHSLADRFQAGQEVDCWVKECSPRDNKLRLQLYPYHRKENDNQPSFQWDNYTVGSLIQGVVVKFSDYGAYVDVGAPVFAFLHRHKMKSNRRQRKLQSWEIYPLGTQLTEAWVYQIDPYRKRIEITTFPPEVWDWRFPRPHEKISSRSDRASRGDEDIESQDEDEEENFDNPEGNDFSERKFAAMFGNLEKELRDDDEANDEESDILSSEEVHRLTGKRLLIDDLAAQSETTEGDKESGLRKSRAVSRQQRKKFGDEEFHEDNEITPQELFAELTNGHGYLTLTHLRKWYYIQTFLEENYVTNDQLRRLFREAGGFRGRLTESQFEEFLELFQEEMGLREFEEFDEEGNLIASEEDEEEEELEEEEEVEENSQKEDSIADEIESDLDQFGKRLDRIMMSERDEVAVNALEQFQQQKQPSTVKRTTKSLFRRTTSSLKQSSASSRDDKSNQKEEEEEEEEVLFVSALDRSSSGSSSSSSLKPIAASSLSSSSLSSLPVVNLIAPQEKMTAYDNILISSFNDLRKRSAGVTVEDVLRWKLIKSMLEEQVTETEEVKRLFEEIVNGKSMMNFQQFKLFSERLQALDLGRSSSSSPSSSSVASSSQQQLMPQKKQQQKVKARAVKSRPSPSLCPTAAPSSAPTSIPERDEEISSHNNEARSSEKHGEKERDHDNNDNDNDTDEEHESNGDDEDDDDDDDDAAYFMRVMKETEEKDEKELIQSMFYGFSNNKPYVKASALLEWDLVTNLIGGGVLTEESFRAKIKEMSQGKPGLDLAGFDQLLTDLLMMYQEPEDSEGSSTAREVEEEITTADSSSSFRGFDPKRLGPKDETEKSPLETELVHQNKGEEASEEGEKEDDDDDNSFELNIDEWFEELSQGKSYVTPQAIRDWELVKDLLETGALTEIDLNRTLASIQPKKKNQFTIHDFALCVDELFVLAGFEVEGYEEREFSDYGEPDDEEDRRMSHLLQQINVNELIGSELLPSEQ